jgi:tetratricopeptide (TPR) repeat protein
MRKIFRFLFIVAAFPGMATAQSYYLERVPDMPGAYRKTSHSTTRAIPSSDNARIAQMMDAVVDAFKKAYAQPVGVDVGPYGGLWEEYKGPSEVENGPYSVYVTIPFFDLYKIKSGGTEASGEYASSMEIWINKAKYLLQANNVHDGNDRVFRAPWPGLPVNGFPKYNNMILILPPGKALPWRPATREEYLENYIASKKKSTRSRDTYEQQKIAEAEQFLASMSPSERKQTAYLKKPKYSGSEFGEYKWSGFSDASDTTADQLVIIDENFYDKKLSRNSFQVMVIERQPGRKSYSAARPRPEELAAYQERADRMNNIVRSTGFLPDLQHLLGKNGVQLAGTRQTTTQAQYAVKKIDRRNIDRRLDSLFRNYTVDLPAAPGVKLTGVDNGPPPPALPERSEKKLSLASRRLETKEELVRYLDELDKKLSEGLGTTVTEYDAANTNNMASYGYWLMDKPRQSLLLAVKAARQQPDNDCMLNNLGANLSVCGIDYMAVPLYIVCLKKEPANSTITNNLGQSYLAMGDLQHAETYLKQAIAATPYHHHANNSLGLIYEKQGRKNEAISCYENSLRSSFTLNGYNGLKRLKRESALKLMDYIRHRYRQPDYLNFDKYSPPAQCMNADETEVRQKEHSAYTKMLNDLGTKFQKLRDQQYAAVDKELKAVLTRGQQGKAVIRPFQPFAKAVLVSLRHDFEDNLIHLEKELAEMEKQKAGLKMEYDTVMKMTLATFEERLDKLGEGNADPTLDEDICNAKNAVVNHYLPLFADNNELRFNKIFHVYRDYLNDYLYWVRLASWGIEEYRLNYYDLVLSMVHMLREVRLTTLHEYCGSEEKEAKNKELEIREPDCPLPIGVEIPLIVGKIGLDCESWGLELGEVIVLNIDHKFGGETTIAIGPGETFYATPKITPKDNPLSPGVYAVAKGQVFFTFEGSTIVDGGFLWEAEVDVKGLGKPVEFKQNFTWAVNKGFTAEGQLTKVADKIFEIPPETQVNKNVKIFKPGH